jgi:hypothetical protein
MTNQELIAEEEEAFKREEGLKIGGILGIVLASLLIFLHIGC